MGENKGTLGMIAAPAAGLAGDIIGMLGQRKREERAMKNQEKLMGIQRKNQEILNSQGAKLARENWDYTNYENQRKHLEAAGLNAGLLYGQSGGGGSTLASGSGGGASGGGAPAPQPMEIGSALQNAATAANIELMKANAKKANAEAEATAGYEAEKAGASTELTKAQKAYQEGLNKMQNATLDEQIDGIKAIADKQQSEARSALVAANKDEQTQNSEIARIKQEGINTAIEAAAKEMKINLDAATIRNMSEQIKLGKYNAEKITQDQVKGKAMNIIMEKIAKAFGLDITTTK